MSRHPLDHGDPTDTSRTKEFVRVDRKHGAEGPHPNTAELQRRSPGAAAEGARVAEYARIERGEQT